MNLANSALGKLSHWPATLDYWMSSSFSRKPSQKLRWRVIGEDILWGFEREMSHSHLNTCSLVSYILFGEIGGVALLKEVHTGVRL